VPGGQVSISRGSPLHEDEGIIRVIGTRVTLESIVAVFDRGGAPEEIAQSFPSVRLADAGDPEVLAWAASEGRVVLTHDVRTMTRFAYDRGRLRVRKAVEEMGFTAEVLSEHFDPNALDTEWIPTVANRGWVILTRDRNILRNRLELQLVMGSRAA
jgi:predicted nuclease of predicted toxin-antitoxin system